VGGNALPPKISGPELKTGGNEVAVETIEITHEGLIGGEIMETKEAACIYLAVRLLLSVVRRFSPS